MSKKPDFVMQTLIRCTQDALWDALTNPDTLTKYHFAADRISRDGNKIIYHMPDGGPMLTCTETKLDPKTRIESTFEPSWMGPEVAMPKSSFVYLIAVEGAHCRLTLEHYDIPADQPGIADGWARELSGLKTFLETGEPVAFANAEGHA